MKSSGYVHGEVERPGTSREKRPAAHVSRPGRDPSPRLAWLRRRGDDHFGDEHRFEKMLGAVLFVERDLPAAGVHRHELRVLDRERPAVGQDDPERPKRLLGERLAKLVQCHRPSPRDLWPTMPYPTRSIASAAAPGQARRKPQIAAQAAGQVLSYN